tara:strand:+ start:2469 stop:2816 length:348 start_codon:yes stop_codon:yes gene_type:complete
MSLFRYVNAKKDLTTTNATDVYACPSKTIAVLDSIVVSEDSGNADTITLTLIDAASSPATFSLYKTKAISANGTAELLTHSGIYLTAGEKIVATAATANRLHIILSIREIFLGTN